MIDPISTLVNVSNTITAAAQNATEGPSPPEEHPAGPPESVSELVSTIGAYVGDAAGGIGDIIRDITTNGPVAAVAGVDVVGHAMNLIVA